MLSREPLAPYSRPALSKGLWRNPDMQVEDIFLPGPELEGLSFFPDTKIVALDRKAKLVRSIDGSEFGYQKLILATSGDPVTLGIPGSDKVLHYRDLPDYEKILKAAEAGKHIVVVGGGFIGQELSAVLSETNAQITWVFAEPAVGAACFPIEIVSHLEDVYAEHGVELVPESRLKSAREEGEKVYAVLENGDEIEADLLVLGLGIKLDTNWLQEAGLQIEDGVVVDKYAQSSDPDIYACGDLAAVVDPVFGRRRIEHKVNAQWNGQCAGRNAAGGLVSEDRIAYFYSFLYESGYEGLGRMSSELKTVVDWKEIGRSLVVYYLDEQDLLQGVLLWNHKAAPGQEDYKAKAQRLLADRTPRTEADLLGQI